MYAAIDYQWVINFKLSPAKQNTLEVNWNTTGLKKILLAKHLVTKAINTAIKTRRRYWLSDFKGWIRWAPGAERATWAFSELKLTLFLTSQSGVRNEIRNGVRNQPLQGRKCSLCAIWKRTSFLMWPLLKGEGSKQQHGYACLYSAFPHKQLKAPP